MVHQMPPPSENTLLEARAPSVEGSRKPRMRVYPQIASWGALNMEARRDSLPSANTRQIALGNSNITSAAIRQNTTTLGNCNCSSSSSAGSQCSVASVANATGPLKSRRGITECPEKSSNDQVLVSSVQNKSPVSMKKQVSFSKNIGYSSYNKQSHRLKCTVTNQENCPDCELSLRYSELLVGSGHRNGRSAPTMPHGASETYGSASVFEGQLHPCCYGLPSKPRASANLTHPLSKQMLCRPGKVHPNECSFKPHVPYTNISQSSNDVPAQLVNNFLISKIKPPSPKTSLQFSRGTCYAAKEQRQQLFPTALAFPKFSSISRGGSNNQSSSSSNSSSPCNNLRSSQYHHLAALPTDPGPGYCGVLLTSEPAPVDLTHTSSSTRPTACHIQRLVPPAAAQATSSRPSPLNASSTWKQEPPPHLFSVGQTDNYTISTSSSRGGSVLLSPGLSRKFANMPFQDENCTNNDHCSTLREDETSVHNLALEDALSSSTTSLLNRSVTFSLGTPPTSSEYSNSCLQTAQPPIPTNLSSNVCSAVTTSSKSHMASKLYLPVSTSSTSPLASITCLPVPTVTFKSADKYGAAESVSSTAAHDCHSGQSHKRFKPGGTTVRAALMGPFDRRVRYGRLLTDDDVKECSRTSPHLRPDVAANKLSRHLNRLSAEAKCSMTCATAAASTEKLRDGRAEHVTEEDHASCIPTVTPTAGEGLLSCLEVVNLPPSLATSTRDKGTRRNKTGTKKSGGRDDASEEGGAPSTPPTPASRSGGLIPTTIAAGGSSSSTLSSLNMTVGGGAGTASASALPLPRTKSETRKFTSEAAKRLSAGGGSRKSLAADEGAHKTAGNEGGGKNTAGGGVVAPKKTLAEHSRRTTLEPADGAGGGGASKRLRSASNSSARGGSKRLSGAGLHNSLNNPTTSQSPSCGARTSGPFTAQASSGTPRQGTFTVTPGSRVSTRPSSTYNKDNNAFTNNKDQSTGLIGGKTTITGGLMGKLGGGSGYNKNVGGGGRAIKSGGITGTGSSQRSGGRTATVTPSDVAFGKRTPHHSLPRFGFIDSTSLRSGDSTDSVNSILSDVLLSSDSNSNILDYYEEHSGNRGGGGEKIQGEGDEDCLSKRITKTNNLKNNLLLCQPSSVESRSASSSRCDDVIVHSCSSPKSPTSISQASSGVTAAATTARLKAHTHQLPQPQLPAVRSFSTSASALNERKISSSSSFSNAESVAKRREGVPFGQRKRPVSMTSPDTTTDVSCFQPHGPSHKLTAHITACPVTFKAVTNGAVNKSFSVTPSPVDEKESESPKSISTLDSGLGSSMEGDKLKDVTSDKSFRSGYALGVVNEKSSCILPPPSVHAAYPSLDGRLQVTDIKRNNFINAGSVEASNGTTVMPSLSTRCNDDTMKTSLTDESDKWLREKKTKMGKSCKFQTGTFLKPAALSFTNVLKVDTSKQPTTSVEPVASKELASGNEPYMTYGVARQNFAVSDRNRFGFLAKTNDTIQPSAAKLDSANKSKLNKSPSDPGKRLACYNSTTAYASKLTRVNSNPSSMKTTTFRPTSLIKTPILVTPVSNETVEISKPILKKLEYTAGSSCSGKDSVNSASVDRVRSHRKNSAEDLLILSCLEVQVSTDEGDTTSAYGRNEQSSPNNSSPKNKRELAFNKKLNHKTLITSSYNILESPSAPESMLVASKLDGFSLVSPSVVSRDETKLLSPESESSFEVLDSPSEGLDYTDSSACNTVLCQDPAYRDTLQDANIALGNVSGYLQQYDVELIADESTLEKPKLMESPLHRAQQQQRDDRHDIPSSPKVFNSSGSSNISEDVKLSGCYGPQVDRLTTSLEKSSMIESHTNAVLRESLELPITANSSSDNSREAPNYSNNHSAFYSITATTSSGSSDIQHQFDQATAGGRPLSGANEEGSGQDNNSREGSLGPEDLSKTDAIEKFMNNLNNSKLEIVDILNNFAIKPGRTESTSLGNSLNDVNQNISVPQYSQTFGSETINRNLNFSSIDKNPNQTTFNTTSTALTADSTTINESQVNYQEVRTSTATNDPVPDLSGGTNSTSIMTMSTSSSVFSEANSSPGGRFTPSSRLTRCHSSNGGASGGLQPNTSSSGGGGTGSSVTGGPADIDQDFLIDDEISDQPDLTFYGDDMCSASAAGRGLDQSDLGPFGDVDDYLKNYQLPPPQQLQKYRQEPVCSSAKKRTSRTAIRENSSVLDEDAYHPGEEEGEHESEGLPYDTDCEGQQQQQQQQGRQGDGEDFVSSDDEGIFGDDLQQPSPCHAVRRVGVEVVPGGTSSAPSSGAGLLPLCFDDLRTAGRPDSVCTLATSLDPDDFMLDFEIDDFSSQRCATPPGSLGSAGCGSSSLRSTGSNSRHCSPLHGPGSTNGSGLKRPLGSLTRADGSKPTRLPVLRQQLDGEHPHGSPVPALDKALQQQLLQDCHSTKSMLLQLRNLLLHADTAPPFALSKKMGDEAGVDGVEASNGVLGADQAVCTTDSIPRLVQQNADLRRQVTLLQQQLEERDRTMRNLQQRLHVTSSQAFSGPTSLHSSGSAGVPGTSDPGLMSRSLGSDSLVETSKNAATQTDRPGRPLTSSSLTRPPSIDDGLGPTVSSEDVIGAPYTNGVRRPPSRLAFPSPCLDNAASNASETRSTQGSHQRLVSHAGLDDALDSGRIPRTGVTSCSDTSTDGKASFLRCSSDDCANTLLCSSNTSCASSNGGYPSSARCRHLSGESILSSNSSVDGEPILSNGHYTNGCSPSSALASNDQPSQYTSQHNAVSNRGIGGRFTRRQSPSREDITCKTFQERKEMFSAVSPARGLAAHQPS